MEHQLMPKAPKLIVLVLGALALAGGTVTAFAVSGDSHGQSAEHSAHQAGLQGQEGAQTSDTDATDATDATTNEVSSEDSSVERYWDTKVCGEDMGKHGNHGDFVRMADRNGEARREAAHSPCGKPLAAVGDSETTDDGANSDVPHGHSAEHLNQTHGPPADPGAQGNGGVHGNSGLHGKP
jgi:hypothetical protein